MRQWDGGSASQRTGAQSRWKDGAMMGVTVLCSTRVRRVGEGKEGGLLTCMRMSVMSALLTASAICMGSSGGITL